MRCRSFALLVALGLARHRRLRRRRRRTARPQRPSPARPARVPSDPIARVVYEFFDAVRQGRTAEANQLLTPLALQRITAMDMNIAPPGSPTARFQVGRGQDASRTITRVVELTWTDLDADGKPYDEPILCELRDRRRPVAHLRHGPGSRPGRAADGDGLREPRRDRAAADRQRAAASPRRPPRKAPAPRPPRGAAPAPARKSPATRSSSRSRGNAA